MVKTYTVGEREQRGACRLESGQLCHDWLPAGEYAVLGRTTLRGRDGEYQASELRHAGTGRTWYSSPLITA